MFEDTMKKKQHEIPEERLPGLLANYQKSEFGHGTKKASLHDSTFSRSFSTESYIPG